MKTFGLVVLLIGLGAANDGPNYGNIGQLRNYGGIYISRYSHDDKYDQGYGPAGAVVKPDQDQNQGGLNSGLAVAGDLGLQGGLSLQGGLGLSAGLGLQAGLSAGGGLATNLGAAIGVGINANLQLNLNASLGLTNEEDIVRPCNLDDWQCIRRFFAANSQCSPSYGPVPDPLFLAQSTVYIPLINLNLLLTNVRITGLGGASIKDFYVNRVTGNLVLSINIQNLNETSPQSYARYHRQGKESITLVDVSALALTQLSLTAVIPRLPNLRLDLAEIHADYGDESPRYDFGPAIFNSTNSLVVAANAQLSANIQTVLRESFLFQAQLIAAVYIQQNICDFGVKLSSY